MDLQKVGAFIQKKRKELNMSQQAFGEYFSVTDKAVSKWERGLACPDIDKLKSMALLFHCSISEIIGGKSLDRHHSSNALTDPAATSVSGEDPGCDVTVSFDLNSTRIISPFLFGDNLEHTRDCINSGLSAQMLKNRKFVGKPSRYGCADGWYRIGEKTYMNFSAPYTKHYEGHKMNRALECNSQLIVNYHSGTISGIGQKGLCVKGNTEYDFSMVAYAFSKTDVTIRLTSADGRIYDEKVVVVDNPDFQEKKLTLIPDGDDNNASLEIVFESENAVTLGAVSLMPHANFHGMRPDVIDLMKQIGMKLLRWPGGNFAGEYSWKDGLLPRDQRAPFQSYLGLETQPHTLGFDFHEINTDDYIALCQAIGAQPFITINPAWNTPEESAQWVEYCNADESTPFGRLRAQRGHREPYNVQFWSLGNEFGYGHMEGPNSPYDYSRIVSAHAEKMLQVSPELNLCSSGPYPNQEWADHSARVLRKVAPLVSLHHYATFPAYIDPAKRREEYYQHINSAKTGYLTRIQLLRQQLNDDSIKISFDEWNTWYAWYRGGSVSEGILAASIMNMFFLNADEYGVAMACHFESVNEGAILITPDGAKLTPTGQALSIMSHHAGGMVCDLQEDAVVTRKGNLLTCTFINRSYDGNKTFFIPDQGEVVTSVLYSSDDIVAYSVFEEQALPIEASHATRKMVLPCHSLALVQIKLSDDK